MDLMYDMSLLREEKAGKAHSKKDYTDASSSTEIKFHQRRNTTIKDISVDILNQLISETENSLGKKDGKESLSKEDSVPSLDEEQKNELLLTSHQDSGVEKVPFIASSQPAEHNDFQHHEYGSSVNVESIIKFQALFRGWKTRRRIPCISAERLHLFMRLVSVEEELLDHLDILCDVYAESASLGQVSLNELEQSIFFGDVAKMRDVHIAFLSALKSISEDNYPFLDDLSKAFDVILQNSSLYGSAVVKATQALSLLSTARTQRRQVFAWMQALQVLSRCDTPLMTLLDAPLAVLRDYTEIVNSLIRCTSSSTSEFHKLVSLAVKLHSWTEIVNQKRRLQLGAPRLSNFVNMIHGYNDKFRAKANRMFVGEFDAIISDQEKESHVHVAVFEDCFVVVAKENNEIQNVIVPRDIVDWYRNDNRITLCLRGRVIDVQVPIVFIISDSKALECFETILKEYHAYCYCFHGESLKDFSSKRALYSGVPVVFETLLRAIVQHQPVDVLYSLVWTDDEAIAIAKNLSEKELYSGEEYPLEVYVSFLKIMLVHMKESLIPVDSQCIFNGLLASGNYDEKIMSHISLENRRLLGLFCLFVHKLLEDCSQESESEENELTLDDFCVALAPLFIHVLYGSLGLACRLEQCASFLSYIFRNPNYFGIINEHLKMKYSEGKRKKQCKNTDIMSLSCLRHDERNKLSASKSTNSMYETANDELQRMAVLKTATRLTEKRIQNLFELKQKMNTLELKLLQTRVNEKSVLSALSPAQLVKYSDFCFTSDVIQERLKKLSTICSKTFSIIPNEDDFLSSYCHNEIKSESTEKELTEVVKERSAVLDEWISFVSNEERDILRNDAFDVESRVKLGTPLFSLMAQRGKSLKQMKRNQRMALAEDKYIKYLNQRNEEKATELALQKEENEKKKIAENKQKLIATFVTTGVTMMKF